MYGVSWKADGGTGQRQRSQQPMSTLLLYHLPKNVDDYLSRVSPSKRAKLAVELLEEAIVARLRTESDSPRRDFHAPRLYADWWWPMDSNDNKVGKEKRSTVDATVAGHSRKSSDSLQVHWNGKQRPLPHLAKMSRETALENGNNAKKNNSMIFRRISSRSRNKGSFFALIILIV